MTFYATPNQLFIPREDTCKHCSHEVIEYRIGKWIHKDPDHFDSGCCFYPIPKTKNNQEQ